MFRNRSLSPVELAQHCLDRIEKLNPILNAFITVTGEMALRQAAQAEAELMRGEDRGPLHGIPVGIKDLIDSAGVLTSCGSAIFKERLPRTDAGVVTRLLHAGAVLLGKQNLHEFAYGGSSLVSYYGDVRSAWSPVHIAGGSSGGSATAVAAGLGLGAIGTDTAGSVREPAALCGVVGLKPTYGKINTKGVFPLSPSLDHVGPIAGDVADTALLYSVFSGSDFRWIPGGPTARPLQLRIGVPRPFFYEAMDPEVGAAVEKALSVLNELGCAVQEINLEVPTDRTLQSKESYESHRDLLLRGRYLYQPETLRRILAGENISMEELASQQLDLARLRREAGRVFKDLDVLITPTTPITAPLIADLKAKPDQLRPTEMLLLRNTRPFNVWGLPAVSVPCGFTKAGLPIGLQIAGPAAGEEILFRVAAAYEQATQWHKMHSPPMNS